MNFEQKDRLREALTIEDKPGRKMVMEPWHNLIDKEQETKANA